MYFLKKKNFKKMLKTNSSKRFSICISNTSINNQMTIPIYRIKMFCVKTHIKITIHFSVSYAQFKFQQSNQRLQHSTVINTKD